MVKSFVKRLVGPRANRLFLVLGILLTIFSLYKLLRTAMYVHESVVVTATVTDVLQKPFESTGEALSHGNLALGGSTSYQAIVRYTVPSGMVIDRMMTDADDTDYTVGQQVEVITPELDPSRAHINKWKFIWGWECAQLGGGVILLLTGLALRERKPAPAPAPRKKPSSSGGKKKSAPRKKSESGTPRKRSPRKKKAQD
ncbi:MAG: DUF3592 domain-containing protein [Akkermansia sp.]|nr:DUF3592 domain-containing protein [Akkermansia sp.]